MASRKIYLVRSIEDVEAHYPDDGDALTWVAASGMWMPIVGGGEGGGHTIQDEGVDQTQRTNLNFVGNAVTVLDDPGNDATKVTIDLASGILSQEVYETLTAQVVSGISHFNLSDEIIDDSLRVYYNGIRQQGDYFVVDFDNLGFTTDFVVEVGDEIFVDYEITTSGVGLIDSYFTSLLDTPSSFVGDGEKFVKVNVGEDALEFVTTGIPDDFPDLGDTPANYTAASGLFVKVTDTEDGLEFSAVEAGAGTFLALTDVPNDYSGQDGKVPAVNAGEDGLEFVTVSGGSGASVFTDLTDTPADYTDDAGKTPIVNLAEDALEFALLGTTAGAGDGHVTINPESYSAFGGSDWQMRRNEFSHLDWYMRNASVGIQNDYLEYNVYLDVGTYSLMQLHHTNTSGGIVDIQIDGSSIGSIDLYSGSLVWNIRTVITDIVITEAGMKTLKFLMSTKNGSSSGYTYYAVYTAFWRTDDPTITQAPTVNEITASKQVIVTNGSSVQDAHTTNNVWEDIVAASGIVTLDESGDLEMLFNTEIKMENSSWEYYLVRFQIDTPTGTINTPDMRSALNSGSNPSRYWVKTYLYTLSGMVSGDYTVKAQWHDGNSGLDASFYDRQITIKGTWDVTGGGIGNMTFADTEDNEPAADTDGNLFFPTDGIYIKRDTGTIWQPWGPLMPMVEPILGDFAWVNQGTAVVDDTYGGLFMTALAAAGDSHKILKVDAPATPYTLTVGLIPQMFNYNYQQCGIGFRQSGDGKLASITLSVPADEIVVNKWNSPSSYNATYVGYKINIQYAPMAWLRIEDDGVDRKCYWSLNGAYWTEIHSVGRTDFLTADEIYVYVSSSNATYPASLLVLSWLLE